MRHEEMHRGSPVGRNAYHLVAALFDRDSGNRITQANISATVQAPGKASLKKDLEPMMVADAVTFGNYFTLPSSLSSKIELAIELRNKQQSTAVFDYSQNTD